MKFERIAYSDAIRLFDFYDDWLRTLHKLVAGELNESLSLDVPEFVPESESKHSRFTAMLHRIMASESQGRPEVVLRQV